MHGLQPHRLLYKQACGNGRHARRGVATRSSCAPLRFEAWRAAPAASLEPQRRVAHRQRGPQSAAPRQAAPCSSRPRWRAAPAACSGRCPSAPAAAPQPARAASGRRGATRHTLTLGNMRAPAQARLFDRRQVHRLGHRQLAAQRRGARAALAVRPAGARGESSVSRQLPHIVRAAAPPARGSPPERRRGARRSRRLPPAAAAPWARRAASSRRPHEAGQSPGRPRCPGHSARRRRRRRCCWTCRRAGACCRRPSAQRRAQGPVEAEQSGDFCGSVRSGHNSF